jgi:hypothetical protein
MWLKPTFLKSQFFTNNLEQWLKRHLSALVKTTAHVQWKLKQTEHVQ